MYNDWKCSVMGCHVEHLFCVQNAVLSNKILSDVNILSWKIIIMIITIVVTRINFMKTKSISSTENRCWLNRTHSAKTNAFCVNMITACPTKWHFVYKIQGIQHGTSYKCYNYKDDKVNLLLIDSCGDTWLKVLLFFIYGFLPDFITEPQ